MSALKVKTELKKVSSKKRKETNEWFFKTGKGEYGEGDKFMGVSMPDLRKVAKSFLDLPFEEISKLLESKIHEHRLAGLVVLVENFKKADEKNKKKIFNFYRKNLKHINNWDLVDISCPYIIGGYLLDKEGERKQLYTWAKSKDLWKNRVAIVSTWYFIRNNDLKDVYLLSEILLNHEHDLIHKAVGWMLREAGKKDEAKLKKFLDKHTTKMPRTMLRYSLEKFSKKDKKYYMDLK